MLRLRTLLTALLLAGPSLLQGQGTAAGDFTLKPGDLIELFAWREPDFAAEYPVDERGRVTLPLVGTHSVTGAPWRVVRDSLLAAFARELRDGDVRLTPKRRVLVLGFVQKPGAYFADPTVNIAGAIALAEGVSSEGNARRIRVVRDGTVVLDRVSLESADVLGDVHSGDQIIVSRRGWFDRNSAFMVSAVVGLAGIVVTLIVST